MAVWRTAVGATVITVAVALAEAGVGVAETEVIEGLTVGTAPPIVGAKVVGLDDGTNS